MKLLWMVVGFMAVLIFLWFETGGYKNADLNGIFINPLAPLGPGTSYGPQPGTPNPDYTNTTTNQ